MLLFLLYTCNEGDLVDAVVPFMGEYISDGILAKFLKSMFFPVPIPIVSLIRLFILYNVE